MHRPTLALIPALMWQWMETDRAHFCPRNSPYPRVRIAEALGSIEGSRNNDHHGIPRYTSKENVEKLSIALAPEMARIVRGTVESAEYAIKSDVVREARHEWEKRRALRQDDVEEVRRLWTEGHASGPGRLADIESIKAETVRRLHQQRSGHR